MGKSITPYSHVVDQVEALFAPYKRCMRRPDQKRFEILFNYARKHTPGGVLLADPDPFRPVVLGMLVELLRRVQECTPTEE